jgi:peptidoglycan hydrolase-like protein with peptidoglycan-binding domain
MLYPLGWLPPEVPHPPVTGPGDGSSLTVRQANSKLAQQNQGPRTRFLAPELHPLAGAPALSGQLTLAQRPSQGNGSASVLSNGPIPSDQYLQVGDQNPTVKVVQARLEALGYYKGPLDGIFGPLTAAAVRAFQQDQSIVVDGIVGPLTGQRLHERYSVLPSTAPLPAAKPAASPQPALNSGVSISSPEITADLNGPVFTPGIIPNLSFHPLEVTPVQGNTKWIVITVLTLVAAGGTALTFKPDTSLSSPSPTRTIPPRTQIGTLHRPQPLYPKARRRGQRQVIHRPQPIYPSGHQPTKSDSVLPAAPPEGAAALPQTTQESNLDHRWQLIQQSPWAIQAQEDYLTNFLYDLQEAESRQQLADMVSVDEAIAATDTTLASAPAKALFRRLGSFPKGHRRTGNPYTYMLLDDMGGCFHLRKNELWLTKIAMTWLNHDEPYTLTIRRIDTTGRTLDKAFTVKLNTFQMEMAS